MALNYDKYKSGNFCYLPKVGERAVFKIKQVNEVTGGQDRFHFQITEKKKLQIPDTNPPEYIETDIKTSLGFHIEAVLEDTVKGPDGSVKHKVLSITSYAAFVCTFKQHQINDGDHVEIYHKGKGEWEVDFLRRGPGHASADENQVAWDE